MSKDGLIHKVKDGEWVGSIAEGYGRDDWEAIWDHPENADLRELRGSPWTLGEGDALFLPPIEAAWFKIETGKLHVFVLEIKLETFRYRLVGLDDDPISDEVYTLEIYQGDQRIDFKQQNDKTDKDGLIVERLPAKATRGTLSFPRIRYEVQLKFGFLSPLYGNNEQDIIRGVQQRLEALGFHPGAIDGIEGPLTRSAVTRFQEYCKENHSKGDATCIDSGPVDGKIGPRTIEAIAKRYGCLTEGQNK